MKIIFFTISKDVALIKLFTTVGDSGAANVHINATIISIKTGAANTPNNTLSVKLFFFIFFASSMSNFLSLHVFNNNGKYKKSKAIGKRNGRRIHVNVVNGGIHRSTLALPRTPPKDASAQNFHEASLKTFFFTPYK